MSKSSERRRKRLEKRAERNRVRRAKAKPIRTPREPASPRVGPKEKTFIVGPRGEIRRALQAAAMPGPLMLVGAGFLSDGPDLFFAEVEDDDLSDDDEITPPMGVDAEQLANTLADEIRPLKRSAH